MYAATVSGDAVDAAEHREAHAALRWHGGNSDLVTDARQYMDMHMAAADRRIGDIVDVEIVAAGPNSLSGVIKASRTRPSSMAAAI